MRIEKRWNRKHDGDFDRNQQWNGQREEQISPK